MTAVAVLGEREAHLSAVQRLALVDAAAWWLSEPNGGEDLSTHYLRRAARWRSPQNTSTWLWSLHPTNQTRTARLVRHKRFTASPSVIQ
nr:hypothetical protein [uncultured bacterium]